MKIRAPSPEWFPERQIDAKAPQNVTPTRWTPPQGYVPAKNKKRPPAKAAGAVGEGPRTVRAGNLSATSPDVFVSAAALPGEGEGGEGNIAEKQKDWEAAAQMHKRVARERSEMLDAQVVPRVCGYLCT